jgi:integrase
VDWLGSRLSVRRGIVMQQVGECKTQGSAKTFVLASDLLARLKGWKQTSPFSGAGDWVFASPFNHGKLPYSYTGTRQELVRAAKGAGIGAISTHSFRHTFRTWLDVLKTPIAVQQKLMRHTDIRVTMGIYGEVFEEAVSNAGVKVAELAFPTNRAQAEREVT